jgi:chitin disaccharide deacetylase
MKRQDRAATATLENDLSDTNRDSVTETLRGAAESQSMNQKRRESGFLILNADDWGRDRMNTDRTLDCVERGTVSAVSAMMFMEDSERSAEIARTRGIDAGLHLNFTNEFSAAGAPANLNRHLERTASHLRKHRLSAALFHPGITGSFEYVAAAQLQEYERLYGTRPERIDGHHHMHLCANVLLQGLLPKGTIVRRNFSFRPGQKSFTNRLYRRAVDGILSRRHAMADYFYSLPPIETPGRLEQIFSLAQQHAVEVETHPVNTSEHAFLLGEEFRRLTAGIEIQPSTAIRGFKH